MIILHFFIIRPLFENKVVTYRSITVLEKGIYFNTFSFAEKKQRIFLAKREEQSVPNYVIINVRLLIHSLNSLLQQQRNRTNKISSEMDVAEIIQLYKTIFCNDSFRLSRS